MMMARKALLSSAVVASGVFALALATAISLKDVGDLLIVVNSVKKPVIEDRYGNPIRVNYIDEWNTFDKRNLEDFPALLVNAVINEEDKRFFEHGGVDWRARVSAIFSNVSHLRAIRGASTITEQVVRILHPRPRTLWSKWIEGFEAYRLESKFSKNEILEFYLNQVPFAKNRRGVLAASRLFYGRDLETLTAKETLSLAVMVKSPSRLGAKSEVERLSRDSFKLAERLYRLGQMTASELSSVESEQLEFAEAAAPDYEARHFVRAVEAKNLGGSSKIRTTLHPHFQEAANSLLNEALRNTGRYRVQNAAVLAVDHSTQEILVWAVGNSPKSRTSFYDSVTTARQPGSSLKPFLYTKLFDAGLSPASRILDEPFATAVGNGVHGFKNYSRNYYGWISLREALANSLNVPAVKLASQIGVNGFAKLLKDLGVSSLNRPVEDYGEGLALGNAEISLYEMVQAYSVLARGGLYSPLRSTIESDRKEAPARIFSEEASSLTANVLSDANARRLEFGAGNAMDFPLQTAVKTGTSTDYRDAWAFAYNYKFVVGVWMGNLDQTPTEGLTGSLAPMMMARSLMARLTEGEITRPLRFSDKLVRQSVCAEKDRLRVADGNCLSKTEYFMPGFELSEDVIAQASFISEPKLVKPTANLRMAIDPRVSRARQIYEFKIDGLLPRQQVVWRINNKDLARTTTSSFRWPIEKGVKNLEARIVNPDGSVISNSDLKRSFTVF